MPRRKQPTSRSDDADHANRASPGPRATIADLPPEIVLQIVDLVRAPALGGCAHTAGGPPSSGAGLFGASHAPPADGDGDEQPMNPGEALLAMMGGLFGMGPGAGGAQAAGAAGQPAGPAAAPGARNAARPNDDSDDDMPPLEGASRPSLRRLARGAR